MKIIALWGVAHCGKSATLNYLRELLRKDGQSLSDYPGTDDEPEAFRLGGIIVGVAPGGDTQEIVEENLQFFKNNNCDIGFSASRTKWGTVYAINDFAQLSGNELEWVEKSYEFILSAETQDICNRETAQLLREKIK